MVVNDEDSLKEALKKEEARIEIEGKYAEEIVIKYGQFLQGKLPEKFGVGYTIVAECAVILDMAWCGILKKYEVESYDKEKVVLLKNI